MNDNERFFFDLNGYLVVEDALTPSEVAACNEAIDHERDRIEIHPPELSLSRGSKPLRGMHGRGDLGGMLTWPKPWRQPFRDLLAHPRIVPYLTELLGDGFRLDHLYGIVMTKGAEGHVLHGGAISDNRTNLYQFHMSDSALSLTAHLIRRAGFGTTRGELEEYASRSYDDLDCVIRIVAVELGLFSFAESFCDILCHFQETERDGACYAPIRRGTPTKVRP